MNFLEQLFHSLSEKLQPLDAQVVLGEVPSTGSAVGVVFYDVEPPAATTDTVQGVQLTFRDSNTNDSRATLALSEGAFQLLHDLNLTDWGDTPINRVWRNSSADVGREESGAYLRSDNYYVRCTRTGPNFNDS